MSIYIQLAQQAVEKYFNNGEKIKPPLDLPAELSSQKGGVFVTIYNNKELRGCIGTFLATKKNLAEEIIANAIAAATQDDRFAPITEKELPKLKYEVSVLGEPEPVNDLQELDPKKYGVIVKSGHKTGLLLPNLAGVDTVIQQISIASQKAGIDLNSEQVEVHKFETTKYI